MLIKRSRSSLRCPLYRIKNCVLIILCIAALNSCKKESLHEDSPNPAKNILTQVTDISYSNFLAKAPLSRLGSLKTALLDQNNGNNLMTSENPYLDLNGIRVYRDSVRQIVSAKGISYVFKMPLASTNSKVFQNFTISMLKDTTIAYVTTYTPSDQWLLDRKKNRFIVFQGDVAYQPMDLNGKYYNNKYISTGKGTGKGNKIASSVTICNSFDLVQTVAYGCSDGNHMPWDDRCAWNTGQEVPDGDYKGGYRFYITPMTVCSEIALPENPSAPGGTGNPGGDTGGGETSPTTPGGYNPCEPGMPCGSIAGDGPAYPFVNEIGLSYYDHIQLLNGNPNLLALLMNYRTAYGNTDEVKAFLKWATGQFAVNLNYQIVELELIYQVVQNQNYNAKDKEPANYYWRTRLSNSNGTDNFAAHLTETTPRYIYPNGILAYNPEASNCHYHSFGLEAGSIIDPDHPKWVNAPALPRAKWNVVNDKVKVGDRVLYFVNDNGVIKLTHSAIVIEIDADGFATKVSSKMSSFQVIEHHPRDIPMSYGSPQPNLIIGTQTHPARLYFRKK